MSKQRFPAFRHTEYRKKGKGKGKGKEERRGEEN